MAGLAEDDDASSARMDQVLVHLSPQNQLFVALCE